MNFAGDLFGIFLKLQVWIQQKDMLFNEMDAHQMINLNLKCFNKLTSNHVAL